MERLIDSHFHFDFIKGELNREAFLKKMENEQIEVIAQTVLPSEYQRISKQKPTKVALGFHPWWIKSEEQVQSELFIFKEALSTTSYIGEVGLDFSEKCLASASQRIQVDTFKRIIELTEHEATIKQRQLVISIHSVRSATIILDILGELLKGSNVIPIFHYFSGTNDELNRIIKIGGYLSINPKMLLTKKGRAYVKQVPEKCLLLETDLPKDAINAKDEVDNLAIEMSLSIKKMVANISEIRNKEIQTVIIDNQKHLFNPNA